MLASVVTRWFCHDFGGSVCEKCASKVFLLIVLQMWFAAGGCNEGGGSDGGDSENGDGDVGDDASGCGSDGHDGDDSSDGGIWMWGDGDNDNSYGADGNGARGCWGYGGTVNDGDGVGDDRDGTGGYHDDGGGEATNDSKAWRADTQILHRGHAGQQQELD